MAATRSVAAFRLASRTVKVAAALLVALLLPLAFAALVGSSVLMGDMIVVGKEYEKVGDLALICVRYRAFGQIERTCVAGTLGGGAFARDAFARCLTDARIGSPLPESCR